MSRIPLTTLIMSLLFSSGFAGTIESQIDPATMKLATGPYGAFLQGNVVGTGLGGAKTDTIYLLGGPLGNGDFQDDEGNPDWEGWIGIDNTAQTESHWHLDTFNCADLDPQQPGNHAWWCGAVFEPCDGADSAEGYGNNWIDYLDWHGTVPDPTSSVTVRVTARLNYDVEPDWDFVYFTHEVAVGAYTPIATFTGDNRDTNGVFVPVEFVESFTIESGDYVGPTHDQVHLRWRFVSDFSYSDQDCAWPTDGAAQIDLIEVYFDQGAGEVQMGETETCESGDPMQWEASFAPGCGRFAKVWPLLFDLDPCRSNTTPQVAFIDDGEVVPGTGGSQCTTWCYGPNGYIVNPVGGLRGPGYGVHNEIWSPVLEWPDNNFTGATFEFNWYLHETLTLGFPGMVTYWGIASTADPTGQTGWGWWYPGVIWFDYPSYWRESYDVSMALVPDCRYVRVALAVVDLLGIQGTDGTPAPYFDNVVLKAFSYDRPSLRVAWPGHLSQDNFPEIGAIDYDNLGANHVRFDAADFVYDENNDPVTPRDYVQIEAAPVRTGSILADLPKMYYRLRPNPMFDPYRTSGFSHEGFVYGDSARNAMGHVIEHRWMFDLPDTGFFFPGDVIHYYFEAQDNAGGDIGTAIIPGDTTGYSLFPGDPGYANELYPEIFVARALPSLRETPEGIRHPEILFWKDDWKTAAWHTSLDNLGYQVGHDYDLYWTNFPESGVYSDLGTRATATQLMGYTTLLYGSGDRISWTMVDVGGGDVTVNCLSSWLNSGNRNMFLTGDGLVYDLVTNGTANALTFVTTWISVNHFQQDVRPLIGNQAAPLVETIPENPVFFALNEWIAHAGCPIMNTFDAVQVAGNAQRIAQFTDPNGQAGAYPYAAAIYNHNSSYNVHTVYLPYDLKFVLTPHGGTAKRETGQLAARTRLLEEVLFSFGHMGGSPTTDVPVENQFLIKCYPNPFNPSTKIEYYLPRQGELAIKIYNVRGELVRTLIDEIVSPGSGKVIWDGRNGRDELAASGVYFYEAVTPDSRRVEKIALIK